MSLSKIKRVIIESPYGSKDAATIERNVLYAKHLLLHSYLRHEAPIASHLLGPQVLDDNDPDQRKLGMDGGWAWMKHTDEIVVGVDFGITKGMQQALRRAEVWEIPVAYYNYKFGKQDNVWLAISKATEADRAEYKPPSHDYMIGPTYYGDPNRVDGHQFEKDKS